jgi:2-iminobutanoate/2-iminopropanoate deaminase
MADREVFAGPDMPKAVGPYSQAVRGAGLLFVSGQPGTDPATGQPVGETFAEQVRQAFRNLETVLQAAGSRADLVVSTTVSVADAAFFPELNDAFGEFFPEDPPARMTMPVPLPLGLLVSVGAVAVPAD